MVHEQSVETTLYSISGKAPEPAQRRNGERYLTVLRVGAMIVDGRRELCLIRNVSTAGMMIRAYSVVKPGERLSIELKQGEPVAGVVRWVKDECVGVIFDAPIDVVGLISSTVEGPRPRMPRVEIDCTAWVREDGTVHRTRAVNISQGGLQVVSSNALTVGASVAVTVNGLAPVPGVVRWRSGDAYGIALNHPLALPDLVGWLQRQQQEVAVRVSA
jgi:hypothetical protein